MKKLLTAIFAITGFAAIAQNEFSTGFDMIECGDGKVIFDSKCANPLPSVMFIHVHENEITAVEAAYKMQEKYNLGCFVTWQSNKERYVSFTIDTDSFKFDPNRIYTEKGRKATLKSNGAFTDMADKSVQNLANNFLQKYIDTMRLVVALHNNTDGGGLTIKSFKKGGDYASDAKLVHINPLRDEDDFFLTTELEIYQYLKKKGFNILLQDNKKVTDDGSLSVYASSKKIPYLNVEAQHGHLDQQLEMLDAVQEMINIYYQ
jgi:hypothetical protein